jgi:hypothetical protein
MQGLELRDEAARFANYYAFGLHIDTRTTLRDLGHGQPAWCAARELPGFAAILDRRFAEWQSRKER